MTVKIDRHASSPDPATNDRDGHEHVHGGAEPVNKGEVAPLSIIEPSGQIDDCPHPVEPAYRLSRTQVEHPWNDLRHVSSSGAIERALQSITPTVGDMEICDFMCKALERAEHINLFRSSFLIGTLLRETIEC